MSSKNFNKFDRIAYKLALYSSRLAGEGSLAVEFSLVVFRWAFPPNPPSSWLLFFGACVELTAHLQQKMTTAFLCDDPIPSAIDFLSFKG